jgi:hypothetical protein
MQMRAAVVVSALGLLLAAGANAGSRSSGLYGIVTRGPITPVCAAEQPCSAPAGGVTLLFVRNGHVVGRAVTHGDGGYRLRLPPGLYTVRRSGPAAVDRKLEPNHARVRKARVLRVDFSIDTGIR